MLPGGGISGDNIGRGRLCPVPPSAPADAMVHGVLLLSRRAEPLAAALASTELAALAADLKASRHRLTMTWRIRPPHLRSNRRGPQGERERDRQRQRQRERARRREASRPIHRGKNVVSTPWASFSTVCAGRNGSLGSAMTAAAAPRVEIEASRPPFLFVLLSFAERGTALRRRHCQAELSGGRPQRA